MTGGRVLCATACGDTVRAAARGAYELAAQVHWRGCWHRNDIGHRAIARENMNKNVNDTVTEKISANKTGAVAKNIACDSA